jgi:hypothetical protein
MIGIVLRSSTLAACALACAGCHLLFGHHPGSGVSGDAAGRPERQLLDQLRTELPMPQELRTEAGTCAPPVPPSPPGYATPCPSTTAACPSSVNKDCDALANLLDPYPTECNALVLDETFGTDVVASKAWHAYSKKDSWRWSCGRLSQTRTTPDDGTLDEAASAVAAGVSLPAHYLVEARVTLGPAAAREHWRVGVIGRVTDDKDFYFIGCSIWENPHAGSNNPVPDPDLVVTVYTPFVMDNGWPYPHAKVDGLDDKEGASYTLQLFYSSDIVKLGAEKSTLYPPCTTSTCPVVFCRVCTESACFHSGFMAIYNTASPMQAIPAGAGTVGFRTLNRAASFERIRVFELKSP